jgi:hypothetical protein
MVAAVALFATACNEADSSRVIAVTMPTPITADADWRTQRGGATLEAMLDEAGLAGSPRVVTLAVAGCERCSEPPYRLVAYYERPGQVQPDLVDEIRQLDIVGLSSSFLGLTGRRDGFIVDVEAVTPVATLGIQFTVLVLPDELMEESVRVQDQ